MEESLRAGPAAVINPIPRGALQNFILNLPPEKQRGFFELLTDALRWRELDRRVQTDRLTSLEHLANILAKAGFEVECYT